MLFGLTPGLIGLVTGVLSGAIVGLRLWRDKPWDIHDEHSYAEPARVTFRVVAPPFIFFTTLVTMMLGLGAIDHSIDQRFGMAGDGLGAVDLIVTVIYLLLGA
jgi:hypothetical protein